MRTSTAGLALRPRLSWADHALIVGGEKEAAMSAVDIVDRSAMMDRLRGGLVLKPRETAIVTIDMHRGHLDPQIATMAATPDDSRRVIAAAEELLAFSRARGLPIIHVKLVFRRIPGLGSEGMAN